MPSFQYLGGDYGKGLLESALAQPSQTFGGRFLYRTIFDKAAALLCSIIKNHSLVDGNKRTGLTTMGVFLAINGYIFYAPQDEAVQRCLSIASTEGTVDWREVSRWIRTRSVTYRTLFEMSHEQRRVWLSTLGVMGAAVETMLSLTDQYIAELEEEGELPSLPR